MDTANQIAAERLKLIREEQKLTQKQFAEVLEIRNIVADMERGRTKISGFTVAKLTEIYGINPMWLYGLNNIKLLKDNYINVNPKVVTVNQENHENMVLVDVKAAAGYPTNVQEPHWYNELPAFHFPLPQYKNATFRGFQVQGDSMLPQLKPKEWVIARAVDNIEEVTNNKLGVVVLKDSVLVKKLYKSTTNDALTLISVNPEYPTITLAPHEIQEIWLVTSKLTFELDDVGESASLHDITLAIERLSKEITALKWRLNT